MIRRTYGFKISEENILVTPGSSQFCFYASNLFTGKSKNKYKKILLPLSPDFTGYTSLGLPLKHIITKKPLIEITGKHSFKYHIDLNNLDLKDIGLVILSRPCNPSGNIVPDEEIKKLIEKTKKRKIPLIIDSAYAPPIPNLAYKKMRHYNGSNVLYSLSLSKAGLAGERIGIVVGAKKYVDILKKFQTNVCINSSKFGQAIAEKAIKSKELEKLCKKEINKYYKRKFELSNKYIKKYFKDDIHYYLHQGEGTFFQWIWFKGLPITNEELYKRIKRKNVLIAPGKVFFEAHKGKWKHKEECIRITLSASNKELEEGIKVIGEVINKTYQKS